MNIHHRGELDFSACMDLKNPWNENKPVKISRDGQVQGTSNLKHPSCIFTSCVLSGTVNTPFVKLLLLKASYCVAND